MPAADGFHSPVLLLLLNPLLGKENINQPLCSSSAALGASAYVARETRRLAFHRFATAVAVAVVVAVRIFNEFAARDPPTA